MPRSSPTAKSFLVFLVLMGIGFSSVAQNLVPNGSFEEGITCPSFVGNLTEECAFWYSSIIDDEGSTPEWFHECSEFDFFQPPEVAFGNQVPAEGGGYVGFATYRIGSIGVDFREIVGVQLIEELNIGQTYLVEFKVSSLEPSGNYLNNNNIGFNFSTHPTYSLSGFPTNTSHYKVDTIITLSEEWTQISVDFTADSAYSYFHIGNFYDDANTEFIIENDLSQAGYYVADDVSVTESLNTNTTNRKTSFVQIYPNPAKNILTIKMPPEIDWNELHIFDAQGREAMRYQNSTQNSNHIIPINTLSPGIYFLKIVTPEAIYSERFINS